MDQSPLHPHKLKTLRPCKNDEVGSWKFLEPSLLEWRIFRGEHGRTVKLPGSLAFPPRQEVKRGKLKPHRLAEEMINSWNGCS